MYTKTQPRKRDEEEEQQLREERRMWMSLSEMATLHNRSEIAISIKLKRLWKKDGNYNKEHIEDKYQANKEFMEIIKPRKVLDLYCWENMWRATNCDWKVYSNDIKENIGCDYHEDAEKLITRLRLEWCKFDLIDLDPYWSAFDCFDKAIRMAKKWLVITLWELWHKRFKRLDYVRYRYDINSLEEFTIDNLIQQIQKIWMRYKKELRPMIIKDRNRIGRVYFEIIPIKITEQRD